MENSKEVTIYDIAKTLDLSPSTISRALNDDPTISKKTKKKIFDTAAEMGYRANAFAKSLRQQSTQIIGVMVDELNSGLMTPILSGIENVAGEAGYGIIITDSGLSATKEVSNAQSLFRRRVDGIIAMPARGITNLDHFRPFVEKNIPVIFLDWVGQFPGSTSIVIDNVLCGRMATQHLIEQGCKRIVFLTPGLEAAMYAQRYAGYRAAVQEQGLTFDLLVMAAATEEEAEAAAKKILALKPLPDGVFVTNDLTAAVCVRAFQEQGIRVPQDIAVVGFGNDIIGKLIKPTLTTVNYPGKEMGETAARVLLNHLKGSAGLGNVSTLTIRTELVIRQSSMRRV